MGFVGCSITNPFVWNGKHSEDRKRCNDVGENPLIPKEFFTQRYLVSNQGPRIPFFQERVRGKSILHIGCCDSPIGSGSLHRELMSFCKDLTGFDVDTEGIQVLAKSLPGKYLISWDDVLSLSWDLVIVPEVLEHQINAGLFLYDVFKIPTREWIITVPHFYPHWRWRTRPSYRLGMFTEIVHPDHRAWYSPHTLVKACEPWLKYRDWSLYFLEKRSMIAIHITRTG